MHTVPIYERYEGIFIPMALTARRGGFAASEGRAVSYASVVQAELLYFSEGS